MTTINFFPLTYSDYHKPSYCCFHLTSVLTREGKKQLTVFGALSLAPLKKTRERERKKKGTSSKIKKKITKDIEISRPALRESYKVVS